MASSLESSAPLKCKVSHVKNLLDDASKRLQDEVSKYEIFTTKASASSTGHSLLKQQQQQNGQATKDVPTDLIRTISDISTLKSVLSCPIFNRIVNVTDSLDKLSYHLNLHPSIGPSDINIDTNGELILTPPIEPTSFNNLVNGNLDEYSDRSNNNSSQSTNIEMVHSVNNHIINGINGNQQTELDEHCQSKQPPVSYNGSPENNVTIGNGLSNQQAVNGKHASQIVCGTKRYDSAKQHETMGTDGYLTPSPSNNNMNIVYNNEKFISQQEINNDSGEGCRLYKSDCHFALNQLSPNNNIEFSGEYELSHGEEHNSQKLGYSNEMYNSTHELNQNQQHTHFQTDISSKYQNKHNATNYEQVPYVKEDSRIRNSTDNGRVQATQTQSSTRFNNRGSCSPSTSAGSTVRLADECDSGASSYQSQANKNSTQYEVPYANAQKASLEKNGEHLLNLTGRSQDRTDSIDQELIEKLSPDLERIKVTLEKDNNGLGITIAGYTCEKEEISGIFIKSITPNSPADRSKKIRTLDQISSVNGRELLGYSNPDAVNVLRHTGKIVTLELMRYLAESKYKKLQTALAHAVPEFSTRSKSTESSRVSQNNADNPNNGLDADNGTDPVNPDVLMSSSTPLITNRNENGSNPPNQSAITIPEKQTYVRVSNSTGIAREPQYVDSPYKNTPIPADDINTSSSNNVNRTNGNAQVISDAQNQIPVAAQRGGTNKVIETKQGARNTIDIRSPVCQTTTTATYVNKITDAEFSNSAKKSMAARLQRDASEEFGRLVEPEWNKDVEIIELHKDPSQGFGFTVKEYANPRDPQQSIIMITSLTPGGIAERDGRLSFGDLLVFVDDTHLEGASLAETVKALKKVDRRVSLGVLKLKRD